MRRKLIIDHNFNHLIASFTLFFICFDQLVIRNEDKLRTKILNTKISSQKGKSRIAFNTNYEL